MSDAFSISGVERVKKVKLEGGIKAGLDAYGRTLKHAARLAPKAAPVHRAAEGVRFSNAALDLLDRIGEIRNDLIKKADVPKRIVDEVIDNFLSKRGISLKSLDKADVKILKEAKEALYSRNVLKTIIDEIKLILDKEVVINNIIKYIDLMAQKLKIGSQTLWDMIIKNAPRFHRTLSVQLSEAGADEAEILAMKRNFEIIYNLLGKIENVSAKTLSRFSVAELNKLLSALKNSVSVQTIRTASAGITAVAVLARQEVLIPAASALGRILIGGASAVGVGISAAGGWIAGRWIGGEVHIKGRNIDSYVQEYFEKRMPNNKYIGVSRHNTEWGEYAKRHLYKKEKKK